MVLARWLELLIACSPASCMKATPVARLMLTCHSAASVQSMCSAGRPFPLRRMQRLSSDASSRKREG